MIDNKKRLSFVENKIIFDKWNRFIFVSTSTIIYFFGCLILLGVSSIYVSHLPMPLMFVFAVGFTIIQCLILCRILELARRKQK